MKPYDKPREAASQALIDLRNTMGLNQAEFAIKVLGSAVTTMSRYETTDPPTGARLSKFAAIAEEQSKLSKDAKEQKKFVMLRDRFRALHGAELVKEMVHDDGTTLGIYFLNDVNGGTDVGYLFARIEGNQQIDAAMSFAEIFPALTSRNLHARTKAQKAVDQMIEAAGEIGELERSRAAKRKT